MKKSQPAIGSKLEALEKWRVSELDHAQVLRAQKQSIVTRNEDAVESVQHVIGKVQNLAREQVAENRVVSVESLTQIRHFTALRVDELKCAQNTLDESRREVVQARAVIVRKFKDLTVLERLRKRRTAQSDKKTLRREERQLDDQALLRVFDSATIKYE